MGKGKYPGTQTLQRNFDKPERKSLRQFGNRVRAALRHALGVSQEDVAARATLHRTYVGSVERGERNVGLLNVIRLAEALEVAPADLLLVYGQCLTNQRKEDRKSKP